MKQTKIFTHIQPPYHGNMVTVLFSSVFFFCPPIRNLSLSLSLVSQRFGAVYGLETLSQLTDRGTFVPGTTIVDFPRYQFRATMIDTSRHYYPLPVILQHLDAMSYSKFNVRTFLFVSCDLFSFFPFFFFLLLSSFFAHVYQSKLSHFSHWFSFLIMVSLTSLSLSLPLSSALLRFSTGIS